MVTAVSPTPPQAGTTATASSRTGTETAAEMQDRFLKLLVAQINSQDPLNPMDNAQMTSQMAQINTVNGIQQVNETLKSMVSQMSALQVLQSASLVGHDVLTAGTGLFRDATGMARGAVDLAGASDNLKIEVFTPGGQLLDTMQLGPQTGGRVDFEWNGAGYQGSGTPVFRASATHNNKPVPLTPLSADRVASVSSVNGTLTLQLQGGRSIAYTDVVAIR